MASEHEGGEAMSLDRDELLEQLKALRKGYGVQSNDISARVGGELRLLCGITDRDLPPARRRKVIAMLTVLIAELPAKRAELARAAFALGSDADVMYEQRIARVAEAEQRDARTIRRRVDEVFGRIADNALEQPGLTDRVRRPVPRKYPWHTAELVNSVMLDLPVVEVLEERRVVSHQEGLTELDHSITITEPPDPAGAVDPIDLGIDIFRGAVLRGPERVGGNRLSFQLGLPHPVGLDEEHVISFRLRVPMRFGPYFVCTPRQPCDRFRLTVRFGVDRVPERIWLLEDEFPLELKDQSIPRPPLSANAAGEVNAAFTDLALNRSYGIGWSLMR